MSMDTKQRNALLGFAALTTIGIIAGRKRTAAAATGGAGIEPAQKSSTLSSILTAVRQAVSPGGPMGQAVQGADASVQGADKTPRGALPGWVPYAGVGAVLVLLFAIASRG